MFRFLSLCLPAFFFVLSPLVISRVSILSFPLSLHSDAFSLSFASCVWISSSPAPIGTSHQTRGIKMVKQQLTVWHLHPSFIYKLWFWTIKCRDFLVLCFCSIWMKKLSNMSFKLPFKELFNSVKLLTLVHFHKKVKLDGSRSGVLEQVLSGSLETAVDHLKAAAD